MELQIGPQEIFRLAGVPITDTMITGFVISVILIISAFLISRHLKEKPGRVQAAAEMFVEGFISLIDGIMPGEGRKYFPMIGTILLYIGASNLVGVVPYVNNPTADINTTVAYALVVFLVSHYAGIKTKGLGSYIKGYFEPIPFIAPLNIIGEFAKPVSHAFRLFGNMVGGGIILAIAMDKAPWLFPVPLMAWFDLFAGVIQAFIFTMLAIVYTSVQRA